MADAYSHLYRYVEATPENAGKADRASEQAVVLDRDSAEAHASRGMASSSQGDFEKAASLYTRASEVNPADFQVPLFLAQTYSSLGRKREEMKVRLGALGTLERHLKQIGRAS